MMYYLLRTKVGGEWVYNMCGGTRLGCSGNSQGTQILRSSYVGLYQPSYVEPVISEATVHSSPRDESNKLHLVG